MSLSFLPAAEEYKLLVLEELKSYEKLYHTVKTGPVTRLMTRQLPLEQLHPNPKDEFCNPAIGPNYSIVSEYQNRYQELLRVQREPFGPNDEPLMVEKISTGGYMIRNGHHRWMAAKRLALQKMRVHIVNAATEEDILSTVDRSRRDMCVSFDLDEVLLTDGKTCPAHREFSYPLNRIFRSTLRRNAPTLINELRRMGFDVWVYTGEYYPERYIRALFRANGTKVDGIINSMRGKGGKPRLREAFTQKYRISLHADNQAVTCVRTRTHDYEMYDIDSIREDWASEVLQKLRDHQNYWYEQAGLSSPSALREGL